MLPYLCCVYIYFTLVLPFYQYTFKDTRISSLSWIPDPGSLSLLCCRSNVSVQILHGFGWVHKFLIFTLVGDAKSTREEKPFAESLSAAKHFFHIVECCPGSPLNRSGARSRVHLKMSMQSW